MSDENSRPVVLGRLVMADPEAAPLHNMTVQVLEPGFLFRDTLLGTGTTDADGKFEIELNGDRRSVPSWVRLRLLETNRIYDSAGRAIDKLCEVRSLYARPPAGTKQFEFENAAVPFWPYRKDEKPKDPKEDWWDSPIARAGAVGGRLPQTQSPRVKLWTGVSKLRFGLVFLPHLLASKIRSVWPGISFVQRAYPRSITQRADSRSDEWLGDRVLNGFNPLLLGRDKANEQRYRWKLEWGDVACDGTHDLSDVDAVFEVKSPQSPKPATAEPPEGVQAPDYRDPRPDGRLVPVKITLTTRTPSGNGDWKGGAKPVEYTPADGLLWEEAKRVFRVQYLLHGEIDTHIGAAHLFVEQFCVAAHRNLRLNPIRHLLLPHFEEIVPTNKFGDQMAWGSKSTTAADSAVKAPEIRRRVERRQGQIDWFGWSPRKPIVKGHTYAVAGRLFWDVLTEYVHSFFDENRGEIAAHWVEIKRLSDDLVAHSVPYVKRPDDPDLEFDDANEFGKTEIPGTRRIPRRKVDQQLPGAEGKTPVERALRPITERNGPAKDDPPGDSDFANLEQLCRFILYHVTFWHCWIHDRQYEDGGEIRYATLSLRHGSIGPEKDAYIAPTGRSASFGLLTIAIGCSVKYGYIVANEQRNIWPEFARLLEQRRYTFKDLGLDIGRIRSRINI